MSAVGCLEVRARGQLEAAFPADACANAIDCACRLALAFCEPFTVHDASGATVFTAEPTRRLSSESTGDCPKCGDAPAYAHSIPGVPDGYADACRVCAGAVVADAYEDMVRS